MVEILTARWEDEPCLCVRNHNPNVHRTHGHHIFPLGWGGPRDGPLRYLCPTSHDTVHIILALLRKNDGAPPWSQMQRFSKYVRDTAYEGWEMFRDATAS